MSLTNKNPLVWTSFYKQITFQVKIDKHLFSLGETIHVEAEVENKGEEVFVHHGSGNCDNTIYFSIQTKEGFNYLIGEGSVHPRGCTEDFREFQLSPNQKINKSAYFKTEITINESNHEHPAKAGEFILTAYYGDIRSTIPIQIQ